MDLCTNLNERMKNESAGVGHTSVHVKIRNTASMPGVAISIRKTHDFAVQCAIEVSSAHGASERLKNKAVPGLLTSRVIESAFLAFSMTRSLEGL